MEDETIEIDCFVRTRPPPPHTHRKVDAIKRQIEREAARNHFPYVQTSYKM